MNRKIVRALILEGLDCAGCAKKIERRAADLQGVSLASLDFNTKILTLEITDSSRLEDVLNSTWDIINELEPEVIVKEKTVN